MIPKPHQVSGALFLADLDRAILADEPRVGKTGTAIMAADYILAQKICVVTTASGRPVWRRAFDAWSGMRRKVVVVDKPAPIPIDADVVIVSWAFGSTDIRHRLLSRRWDLLILDEGHYAKSFEANRTRAVFGDVYHGGVGLDGSRALYEKAAVVWWLTGTPAPNTPADLYPVLRALFPDRLTDPAHGPNVLRERNFLDRYTVGRPFKIGNGWKTKWLPMGGKNEAELRARLDGVWLRRTQQDVGIGEPIFELFPLEVTGKDRSYLERNFDVAHVLEAADAGTTKGLDDPLAKLRRLTGQIKAPAVVRAAVEELTECGLDKLVLMAWHKDTIQVLCDGLHKFGVLKVDGSTSPADREAAEQIFRTDRKARVFVGQIQAAGEAIDLSAAADLWFVEASFTPKDMRQAALRITNHTQTRQTRVRMCVLDGTVDEAVQTVLARKWASIREVTR